MRDYSKVSPRFWIGETGRDLRKLGPEAQVVAFYLFTCPSANMLGLYPLGLPTLCHETGRPLEGALKALRSLREARFAYYDGHSEHVYVPNMAREQVGAQLSLKDNRHVAVLRELEQLRKTPFFNDFVTRYREAFHLHAVTLNPESTGGIDSPFEGPSEPLRSQEQDHEHDQEQEHEQGSAEGNALRAARSSPDGQPSKLLNGGGERKPSPPKTDRGARLPGDFALTPERRAVAEAEGVEAHRTHQSFTDYWRSVAGAKGRKLDWDATWRNWCRKEADTRSPRRGASAAERITWRPTE